MFHFNKMVTMMFLSFWSFLALIYKKIPMVEILFSFFMFFSVKIHFSFDTFKYEGYSFAIDSMSSAMTFLTLWVMVILQLMNQKKSSKSYTIMISLLLLILMEVFLTSNILLFFVFFELSLLPTLSLIIGWGIQPERLQATMFLMLYTLFFSFPFIISLMMMEMTNTCFYNNYSSFVINSEMFYLFMNLVFLTKLPMFFFHSWLPKAHVEAPVFGSMVLASILLKMGGYGLIRFNSLIPSSNMVKNLFISISLLGMVITCLSCLLSMDMKQMIAYSSVSHMNLLSSSIFLFSSSCYSGGLILMISHGLVSSCMFYVMNIGYERVHSRSFLENKFFLSFFPLISFVWATMCMLNMGWPPSLGSLGEVMMMYNIYNTYMCSFPLIMLYLLLSAIYSMIMYTNCCHGKISWKQSQMNYYPLSLKEWVVIFLHIIPCFLLVSFVYPMII